MLVRFAASVLFVLAGAAVVVAPSRPSEPRAEAVNSAIALLGDTWTIGAPAPVELPPMAAPAARPTGAVAGALRPFPRALPSSAAPAAERAPWPVRDAALRKPLPRPHGLSAGAVRPTPVAVAPAASDAPAAAARPSEPRWVVRNRTSGAILAELPLDEALALMTARRPDPGLASP